MATFNIDDDVPAPTKPTVSNDGWATGVKAAKIITESNPVKDNWVKDKFIEPKHKPSDLATFADFVLKKDEHLCMLIGGPLNGQRGLIKGEAKTVELEIYGPNGDVTSVELYALGDNPTPTFRYHVGTRELCVECHKLFERGCVRDCGYCDDCWSNIGNGFV